MDFFFLLEMKKKNTSSNLGAQVHSLKKQVCPNKAKMYTVEADLVM